jgi:hypothetical protein
MSAPRPRSSSRELASRRSTVPPGGARDEEPTLEIGVASPDVIIEVEDEEEHSGSVRAGLDPSPADVDFPDFRRRQPGRTTLAVWLGAAAVVVAGIAWSQQVSRGEHVAASVVAPPPERRVAERAPEPRGTEPASSRATSATQEAASGSAPAPDGVSPEKTVTAVAVTAKTVRVGVRKRVPRHRADPPQPSDSPYAEPSKDSNAAAAPASTDDPISAGTTRAASEPGVSPTEPAPE